MAIESGDGNQGGKGARNRATFSSVLVPVAVVLAVVIVVLGYLKGREHPHSGGDSEFQRAIGQPLPDLELTMVDGKTTHLSKIRGKVTLINFWATWCPPCVKELPSLQKLADRYASQGLKVVGINLDEDPQAVLGPFMEKHRIRFPSYIDPLGKIAGQFSVSGLPLTWVIDSNRKLLLEHSGDEDWFSPTVTKQFELWLTQAEHSETN